MMHIAWMDSTRTKFRCENQVIITMADGVVGSVKPVQDRWALY